MKENKCRILENVIYDIKKAQERIDKDGSRYKIFKLSDLFLTEDDFHLARKVYKKEAEIVFDNEKINSEGVFRGLVYCLLSPRQDYLTQLKGFEEIFNSEISSIEDISNNELYLREILKKAGVAPQNQKANYIVQIAKNWDKLCLLEKIKSGLGKDKDSEFVLRKNLMKELKGVGEKISSMLMRMCGAEYVVPIDSWMNEILYFYGYPCEISRSKINRVRWNTDVYSMKQTKNGLKGIKYLKAEEFTLDLAKRYDVRGCILQLAFWAKKSGYKKELSRNFI
jgi:thermostable 8-oxoguanine DNA glycosylase